MYSIVAGLMCAVLCQHFYRQRHDTALGYARFPDIGWFGRAMTWASYGVFGVLAVCLLVSGLASLVG